MFLLRSNNKFAADLLQLLSQSLSPRMLARGHCNQFSAMVGLKSRGVHPSVTDFLLDAALILQFIVYEQQLTQLTVKGLPEPQMSSSRLRS